MRFDVVTLFPELFAPHLSHGVTRRAFGADGGVDVRLWPLRDFADGAYRRVDDRPFGGGPGMVMLAEPLLRALAAVMADRATAAGAAADGRHGTEEAEEAVVALPVVHFTPTGRRLDQALVQTFADGAGAVLVCGRYEGIDQRFVAQRVTHEVSLGDFVLSGGELPALALLDAVARLRPGVLPAASAAQDSFADGLLEGPRYTRPQRLAIDGVQCAVPPVLMSGDHARIARHEREAALALTARRRPDLIAAARERGRLGPDDERFLSSLVP